MTQWVQAWMVLPAHWTRAQESLTPTGPAKGWTYTHITSHSPHNTTNPPPPTLHVHRGIKQGDSLSSLLFSCYLERILQLIDHMFTQEAEHHQWNTTFQLRIPTSRNYTNPQPVHTAPQAHEMINIKHLEFADDILMPLVSRSAQELLQAVTALITIADGAMKDFGMRLNYDAHKTG
eukprot:4239638-Amphidinium_carterae.1